MMSSRQFLSGLSVGISVVLLACALIVWEQDPFDKFDTRPKTVYGLSRVQDFGGLLGWQTKAALTRLYPHNAIVVGTSKLLDIDPKDLAFFDYFNASEANANLDDISNYLDIAADGMKLVVLGIDFLQFNDSANRALDRNAREQVRLAFDPGDPNAGRSDFSRLRAPGFPANIQYLLNGHAILQGLVQLALRPGDDCAGEIVLYPGGNYNKISILSQQQSEETDSRAIDERSYQVQLDHLRTVNYANFKYSEKSEAALRIIKKKLAQKGIAIVAFLNPINDRELPLLRDMGLSRDYNRFIKAVTDIFGDDAKIPLQDYGDPKYFYDFDAIHFLPQTGAAVVNRMVARHFGVELPTGFAVFDRVNEFEPIASGAEPMHEPALAFDHTIDTGWVASSSDAHPWIGARLPTTDAIEKIVLTQTGWHGGQRKVVAIETSMDGREWQTMTPQPVCVPSPRNTLYVDHDISAEYWRVAAQDGGGTPWRVDELALYTRRAHTKTLEDFGARPPTH